MIRAESGTVWPSKRADKRLTTKGWRLHKGEGERSFTQRINFARAFDAAPAVFVALSAVDLLADADFRVAVSAERVTDASMDVRFATARRSKVWSASASYFAFERRPAECDGDGSARIETGRYVAGRALAGWELSAGGGERRYSARVLFARPFAAAPRVVACIAGVEASKDEDLRVRVDAEDVASDAFRLVVSTWGRSAVQCVTVAWLAADARLAETPAGCSLRLGTQRFRSSDAGFALDRGEGDRETTRRVDFVRPLFERRPRAIVCLSTLDVGCDADNRVKAIETGIAPDGFNLTLGTWNDTVVWGAVASWIAFVDGDLYKKPAAAAADDAAPAAKRPRVDDAAAAAAPAAAAAAPAAAAADGAGSECRICYDAKINTVIVPCGHLCVCFECSKLLKGAGAKCPICRSKIEKIIKTFSA